MGVAPFLPLVAPQSFPRASDSLPSCAPSARANARVPPPGAWWSSARFGRSLRSAGVRARPRAPWGSKPGSPTTMDHQPQWIPRHKWPNNGSIIRQRDSLFQSYKKRTSSINEDLKRMGKCHFGKSLYIFFSDFLTFFFFRRSILSVLSRKTGVELIITIYCNFSFSKIFFQYFCREFINTMPQRQDFTMGWHLWQSGTKPPYKNVTKHSWYQFKSIITVQEWALWCCVP